MATKEKPRKLSVGSDQDLSVSQLADIPLKRRLEILFAANIIPSRRQLALKYQLPERLIHNVLSHRKYLLENWKYNSDPESLLSKLDLENAMAMTELLIEWKRRVQLSGLQITDAALTRKAVYLQRILNACSNSLSDKWWRQFDVNWEYKQFHDYESDSLEMEDILNDLQWMFSENTFRRLMVNFRQAKNSSRIKRGDSSANKINDSDSFGEYFDISDIKVEPHYYNDDDFECEDYEFVLDEEVVLEALRKELEDLEQARYQQYLLGSILSNDSANQEEENATDSMAEESFIEDSVNNEPIDDDIKENMDLVLQQTSTKNMHELSKVVIKQEESSKMELSDVVADTSSNTPAGIPIKLAQLKRKPRNFHDVLSLRKDYVRMPAAAEVAQLARKQCLEQLRKDSESDESENFEEQQKKSKRKKSGSTKLKPLYRQIYKSKTKRNTTKSQSSTEVNASDVLEIQDNHAKEQLDLESSPPMSHHSFTYDSFDDVKQELPSPMISENEEFIVEATAFTEKPRVSNPEQNNNDDDKLAGVHFHVAKVLNRSTRRSNRITSRETGKAIKELENEVILGGSYSFDNNVKQKAEVDIEEEIAGTAIETKDGHNHTDHKTTTKQRISRIGKQPNHSHKKPVRLLNNPIKQENTTPNAYKRSKRRTDGSDLTLRKDKVRLNLMHTTGEKHAANFSTFQSQNTSIETDVQMVFEPYTGDV